MKKALITGASAGIGLEFALQLAEKNYNLILVSRNQQKLTQIAQDISSKHKNINEVLVADLSTQVGIDLVINKIKSDQDIEFIVNNAGLGINKPFHEASLNAEADLLNVLVKAPLEITHSAITSMLKRNKGFIINVGSVAAWTTSGTYSAAKVWLTSFSESLNTNYKKLGINISVVAPGFTRTEFHQRANMSIDSIPNWMWLSSKLVVRDSIKAVFKGKTIVVPSIRYKLLVGFLKIMPRSFIRKFSDSYQSKR
ncbi:MAG: SDR family NAD(P)-dependent oxidoreductase [Actinomycetes bacterium]